MNSTTHLIVVFLVIAVSGCSVFSKELAEDLEESNRWRPCSCLPKLCLLPPVRGLCRAYLKRFYFDRSSGQCRSFIYGGCGGNRNNFKSLRQCKLKCQNVCSGKPPCVPHPPRRRRRHRSRHRRRRY